MKTQKQFEFEQSLRFVDMQLQIFENPNSNKKLTQQNMNQLGMKVKNLKKIFNQMDQKLKSLMRKNNYNEQDLKNKLRKHQQQLQKIQTRYSKLEQKMVLVQKQALTSNRQLNPGQQQDFARLQNHLDRVQNINRQAEETHDIYVGINQEVHRHRGQLNNISNETGEVEHQLGMSEQIMRVIANRELITKLILVLLVFFLGLADLMILLLKII